MFFNQNHDMHAAIAQIVARAPVWMTLRTSSLTTKFDVWIPLRDFRSARVRKTIEVRQCFYIT